MHSAFAEQGKTEYEGCSTSTNQFSQNNIGENFEIIMKPLKQNGVSVSCKEVRKIKMIDDRKTRKRESQQHFLQKSTADSQNLGEWNR